MRKKIKLTVAVKLALSFLAVIVLFAGSFIYANISYNEINELHLYRTDRLSVRTHALLEFRQNFTELRWLIRDTFLSSAWLGLQDGGQWAQTTAEVDEIMTSLQHWHDVYVSLVVDDVLLDETEEALWLATIHDVLFYTELIYGIFDDDFYRHFFVEGSMENLLSVRTATEQLAIPVESHLRFLRDTNEQANERLLLFIEDSTARVQNTAFAFELASVVTAVLLAVLMLISVRKTEARERDAILQQQQIYDANPVPASIWNEDMQIIACNDAIVRFLGMSGKDDYTERFYEFAPEFQQDGTRTTDKIAEVYGETDKKGYCRTAFTHLSAEKEIVPCDVVAVKIELASETLYAVYVLDLRPELEANEKLQVAEKRAQALIDACPLAVALFDEQWNEISSNHTAIDMFGLNEDYDYSKPPDFFISETEGADIDEIYRNVRKGVAQNGRYQAEILINKLDGTPLSVEATYVRLDNGDGDHYLIAAYYRDLTEEKAAMKRERDVMRREQQIYDATPLPASLWSSDYKMLDCTDTALKFFGIPSKQALGDDFNAISPPYQPCGTPTADKQAQMMQEVARNGYVKAKWTHIIPDTGELVPGEVIAARIDIEDDYLVAAYFIDLSEIYATAEREREANELNEIFQKHSPIVMNIWDEATVMTSTSQQAVELFELENMQQYLDRFFELSPEYQPCGTSSREKSLMYNTQAFTEGYVRFEWMHQKLNGEPIPSEIILSRFTRRGKPYLAAFTIDLRPAKAMQEREMSERIQLMLDTAPLMIEYWNKDFRSLDCNKATLDFLDSLRKKTMLNICERAKHKAPLKDMTTTIIVKDGMKISRKFLMSATADMTGWNPTLKATSFPLRLKPSVRHSTMSL